MATVSIRYIVDDVDVAIAFYCEQLGFHQEMHPAPAFAMLSRGDLRLLLSAAGGTGPGGGSQAMPDCRIPEPGGWNRFTVEVGDLAATVEALRDAGARFRNDIVTGVGGMQILVEDPSGNPVELFEPTRADARLDDGDRHARAAEYQVRPIGWVESPLVEMADAPNQGDQGAPEAWLVLNPDVREGIRDLTVGSDIIVLTWLHRARRDELATQPGDDPTGPERGCSAPGRRPGPTRWACIASPSSPSRAIGCGLDPSKRLTGHHWSTSSQSSAPILDEPTAVVRSRRHPTGDEVGSNRRPAAGIFRLAPFLALSALQIVLFFVTHRWIFLVGLPVTSWAVPGGAVVESAVDAVAVGRGRLRRQRRAVLPGRLNRH